MGVIAGADAGDDVLSWSDVLHDGAVPAVDAAELRRVRARELSSRVPITEEEVVRLFELRDERLAAADHVVLWFEHDLFDQLQLLQALDALPDSTTAEAIVVDRYLGELEPEEGRALWRERVTVTAEDRARAGEAWHAFTAGDPTTWELDGANGPLRFADAALRRMRQDLPWTTDGLALTERRLLEPLLDRPLNAAELFIASQRAEEPRFLGDESAFWRLAELGRGDRPLVARDGGALRLTPDGEAVLAGDADRVALTGFDRWLGGTHVTTDWRYDPTTGAARRS